MKLPAPLLRFLARALEGVEVSPSTGETFFGTAPTAGVTVDKDSALQLAPFWACVSLISNALAGLPWGPYEPTPTGGRRPLRTHHLWPLLHDEANPYMSAFSWRGAMMWNALVLGNGYSEIRRDGLWLMDTPNVTTKQATDKTIFHEYQDPLTNERRTLLDSEVFHLKGPSRDGLVGLSVVSAARENIALGLAAQTFGATFFGNNTHLGGVFYYDPPAGVPSTLTPEQFENLKKQAEERKGSKRAHRAMVLDGHMKYVPDTVPPDDAQFLETRKLTAREIAALFNCKPHKIGIDEDGSTARASREVAAIEQVTDCYMPWVIRLEQEAARKLLLPREKSRGVYTHMNVDAHLRADAQTRGEFYEKETRNAGITPNEHRASEERDAVPGGDELLVSRDLIPVSKLAEYADAQITQARGAVDALDTLKADAAERIRARVKSSKGRDVRPFAEKVTAPLIEAAKSLNVFFDAESFIAETLGETDA